MIDPELERRAADCEELMEAWRGFLEMVNRAVRPPQTTTPQLEQQFLQSKARIAMLHDSFMDSLTHDKQTGQNMLEIVNRCITLKMLQKLTEAEIKKMELEWHECFLLLNETITNLHEERERLGNINEFSHNIGRMKQRLVTNIRALLFSFWFKCVVALLIFVGIIAGVIGLGLDNKVRDMRQLSAVTKSWLGFTRMVGMDQPYYDIDEFLAETPREGIDGVFGEVKQRTTESNFSKDSVASQLVNRMNLHSGNPQDTISTLTGAEGYAAFEYQKQKRTDAPRVYLYFFYYKHKDTPKRLELLSDSKSLPNGYYVRRKGNVLIFAQETDTSATFFTDVIEKNVL